MAGGCNTGGPFVNFALLMWSGFQGSNKSEPKTKNRADHQRGAKVMNRVLVVRGSGGRDRSGEDIDATALFIEFHLAINQCKKSPIAPGAHILAGDELGSALADEDGSCGDMLTAKSFYAEALAVTVTAITAAALAFLMCHKSLKD